MGHKPSGSCHYLPPGLQLLSQPLRGLIPVLLLGEQRYDGCEQFAQDCYTTASRLQFEPGPFCAWVQHANHSATEPPLTMVPCINRLAHSLSTEAWYSYSAQQSSHLARRSDQSLLFLLWRDERYFTDWVDLRLTHKLSLDSLHQLFYQVILRLLL